MSNEDLIRRLIKGSIQRAIQESVAALIVVVAFAAILQHSTPGSSRFYGCLLILVGAGFILGVVWSYALSYRMLRTHDARDVHFWREAFHAQARLLRWAPLWYCAPLGTGALLLAAPPLPGELVAFLIVAVLLVSVFAGITWINRRAAACLDVQASCLV